MKLLVPILSLAALLLPGVLAARPTAESSGPAPGRGLAPDSPLYLEQQALDRALFDAYNRCELERFAALLAPDVEFYHDQGGLTRSRAALTDAVRRNICGQTRRELVEGSLEVHEMRGYGALVMGTHRFCPAQGGGRCEGIARFAHLWRFENGTWQATRILSFDHRPNPAD